MNSLLSFGTCHIIPRWRPTSSSKLAKTLSKMSTSHGVLQATLSLPLLLGVANSTHTPTVSVPLHPSGIWEPQNGDFGDLPPGPLESPVPHPTSD